MTFRGRPLAQMAVRNAATKGRPPPLLETISRLAAQRLSVRAAARCPLLRPLEAVTRDPRLSLTLAENGPRPVVNKAGLPTGITTPQGPAPAPVASKGICRVAFSDI